MEDEMLQATLSGNIDSLQGLIEKDNLILNKFVIGCFSWNPLHVAASQGHEKFAQQLLNLNPKLAQPSDSKSRSALHLAAIEGHIDVVKVLLQNLGSGICLETDGDGRYPLHLAAIYGKVQVLEELLLANPDVARTRLERGETILHLCIKHHQFVAMKILLKIIKDEEFINAKDDHGQTILHMLVYKKEVEVINYVVRQRKVHVSAMNLNGQTALDITLMLLKTSTDARNLEELGSIKKVLILGSKGRSTILTGKFSWYDKKDILVVIFSLLTTTSFQVAYNPPGGVWQDDSNGHVAGKAILSYTNPAVFGFIVTTSSTAFSISILAMLFIIVGGKYQIALRNFDKILMVISKLIVVLLLVTFICSMYAIAPWYAFNLSGIPKGQPKGYRKGYFRKGYFFAIGLCILLLVGSCIPYGKLMYRISYFLKRVRSVD